LRTTCRRDIVAENELTQTQMMVLALIGERGFSRLPNCYSPHAFGKVQFATLPLYLSTR
jgi:hypothetical protein